MNPFVGVDFVSIEDSLSEDERLIRDTVRAFVDENAMPIVADHYEKGTFPKHLVKPMAELGLFGSTLDGYGCPNVSSVAQGLILQELERADSCLSTFVSVQSELIMYSIYLLGSDEQKNRWLPKLRDGDAIGCFALTEPDFGSNPSGMISTAVEDGDDYILNGAKMWISNGTIADIAILWAKLDGNITGFIVESSREGYQAKEMTHKLSLRASDTAEVILQDCRIPKSNRLPKAEGLKSTLKCLANSRYGIAWSATGAAMACFHEALEYSKERIQFGKPIASFQLTQQKFADMATEITLSQLLNLQLGRLRDQGKLTFMQASMAKRNCVRKAMEIARTARGILAANGISSEYQTMRHMCNLESADTYEGAYEMHTLIMGREITGINGFV